MHCFPLSLRTREFWCHPNSSYLWAYYGQLRDLLFNTFLSILISSISSDTPPGRDDCGDSNFVDQTSDGSPDVADCLQIIKNYEGDGTTDFTTQVLGKPHHEIGSHGSCKIGVEATKVNGNVNFNVGGQDVIDIVNEAVKQFGGSGKVGAKGYMSCNGNVKSQAVMWGIY